MNIKKSGYNVKIEYNGLRFEFKPVLKNWLVSDLHLLSISNMRGMLFLYTQNSVFGIHNTVMLKLDISTDDIITWLIEMQDAIKEKMRFNNSKVLAYTYELIEKVNL